MMLARPKVRYFGAYPAGFLLRARDMLGVGRNDQVLHVCSGKVEAYRCGPSCKGQTDRHFHGFGKWDITWDIDPDLKPTICGDVRDGKLWRDVSSAHPQIQAVLADPPYSEEWAKEYKHGAGKFPSPSKIVHHAILDILPIGGRVGTICLELPRPPKNNARLIAVFGVWVGFGNIGRTFAVFERTA